MPGGGNHYDSGHVLFLMQTYAWLLEPLKLSETGRRRLLLLAFIAKSSSVEPE
jgi:hypothetical protein